MLELILLSLHRDLVPSYILSLPCSFLVPAHISSPCSNFLYPSPMHTYKNLSSHVLSFTFTVSLFFPISQSSFWKTCLLSLVLDLSFPSEPTAKWFLLSILHYTVAPHVKCLLFCQIGWPSQAHLLVP